MNRNYIEEKCSHHIYYKYRANCISKQIPSTPKSSPFTLYEKNTYIIYSYQRYSDSMMIFLLLFQNKDEYVISFLQFIFVCPTQHSLLPFLHSTTNTVSFKISKIYVFLTQIWSAKAINDYLRLKVCVVCVGKF